MDNVLTLGLAFEFSALREVRVGISCLEGSTEDEDALQRDALQLKGHRSKCVAVRPVY